MKYIKKLNELCIDILLVIVYILGLGLARCIFTISSLQKNVASEHTFWQSPDKKNSTTTHTSPY